MYVFYMALLIERYFEFQEQKVKLGQWSGVGWGGVGGGFLNFN